MEYIMQKYGGFNLSWSVGMGSYICKVLKWHNLEWMCFSVFIIARVLYKGWK